MRFIITVIAVVLGLLGCSIETEKEFKGKKLTEKEALKREEVVVYHKSNDFNQIVSGEMEYKNFTKLLYFVNDVQAGKKGALTITIVNKNGDTEATNSLKSDGEKVEFVNEYEGYHSPKGKFTCEILLISHEGPFTQGKPSLDGMDCKDEEGKDYRLVLVQPLTRQALESGGQE
ncbi:hypothetical protein [Bacillus sp. B-jedd]|uniref:hypothetical protein n=1 Tax=Bacillus sp. B-jedd TaxID=1476857 RepID=UPI000515555C|nr:hypothetical protein [Bacillus sp. B-jedd]CEG27752.1 hypothetical protein BN1002_02624 [Bacillus sp. B-jedd]